MSRGPSGSRVGRPPRFVSVAVVRDLHYQGYSFREIASCAGVGYGTVRRAFHGLSPMGADLMAHAPRRKRRATAGRSLQRAGLLSSAASA